MLAWLRHSDRSARCAVALLLTVAALFVAHPPAASGDPVSAAGPSTARFAALDLPARVLDTRQPGSVITRLPGGGTIAIDPVTAAVAAAADVDEDDVVAVVANLTLDSAGGWGFATVYPRGENRPDASSINTDTVGQTVANMITARLGTDGKIAVYSSVDTDLIIDVQGVYVAANESHVGRLVTVPQFRVRDTRGTGTVPAGGTITVDVTPAGIPTTASAVVLNVTAVEARGWGFLTVWDGIGGPPGSSNVNYVGGSNVANQVIVEIDSGTIDIFSFAETHVLVDVVGYMSGSADPLSTDGLFVPLTPARLLDTRLPVAPMFDAKIGGRSGVSVAALGQIGVPSSGVVALNTNTTLTETTSTGFATVWGDGGLPTPSSLNNVGANRTVANHVITDISDIGCINLYSSARTDAIIDVTGYFVGPADPPPFAPLDLCDQTLTPPPPQPASPPSFGPREFLFRSDNPPAPPPGYGRWDSCASRITYAVNPLRATQREIDEMHFALQEIERATGFDFVPFQPDPTTTEGLDNRRPPRGVDFLIGFSDPEHTQALAGGVIGIGGGLWYPTTGQIVEGFVIIDVPDLPSTAHLRSTLVHEFGHALGLAHVGNGNGATGQIMEPVLGSITTFQHGDKEGLWRVGTAQPCIAAAQRPATETPVLVESALLPGGHESAG